MKKFLAVTTAAAALMLATAANAQDTQLYVTQDASGNRVVMGGANAEGAPILMGTAGAAPSDCPAGQFYEDSRQMVVPCEGGAEFGMMAPGAGMMMPDGQPYPEGAMLLQPNTTPVGDSGTQKSTDSNNPVKAEGGSENNQAGGDVGSGAPGGVQNSESGDNNQAGGQVGGATIGN
jgi:hypothetical protein